MISPAACNAAACPRSTLLTEAAPEQPGKSAGCDDKDKGAHQSREDELESAAVELCEDVDRLGAPW